MEEDCSRDGLPVGFPDGVLVIASDNPSVGDKLLSKQSCLGLL